MAEEYPGFLLAEDAAIRRRLAGLFVSDDQEPIRRVQVMYRHPTEETEKDYPFITIELIDVAFAPARQMSEQEYYYASGTALTPAQQERYTSLDYYPSQLDAAELAAQVSSGGFLSTEQFVAVDLMYQITTHTRNPVHQRQLDGLMLRRVTPMRRGFIEIPEDGTIRRFDLIDWRSADILDQEAGQKKRKFRSYYTMQMNAEIPQSDLVGLQRVLSVEHEIVGSSNLDMDPIDPNTTITEDF